MTKNLKAFIWRLVATTQHIQTHFQHGRLVHIDLDLVEVKQILVKIG